MTVAICVLG